VDKIQEFVAFLVGHGELVHAKHFGRAKVLHVARGPFWTLMILDRMTAVFLLLFLIFMLLQKARRSNRLFGDISG
jgi:hypothetical protein